jgi:hypothetical protein
VISAVDTASGSVKPVPSSALFIDRLFTMQAFTLVLSRGGMRDYESGDEAVQVGHQEVRAPGAARLARCAALSSQTEMTIISGAVVAPGAQRSRYTEARR